jgi:transcriptional regulator
MAREVGVQIRTSYRWCWGLRHAALSSEMPRQVESTVEANEFYRGVVARLTHTNEARTGSEKPWKMTDASKEYIDHMLAAIVGIEIEITKMIGKWKLSQNRDERDRVNAAEELRKRGDQSTSTAMLNAGANKG